VLSHYCVYDLDKYSNDSSGEIWQKGSDHFQKANVGEQHVGVILKVFDHDVGRDRAQRSEQLAKQFLPGSETGRVSNSL
jgi:hypothetical protein